MADLATAHTALRPCLTGSERREVVVEDNLLVILDENFVHLLHVKLGSEGHGSERLGLAAGEDCGTMCARKIANLAPDWTYLCA